MQGLVLVDKPAGPSSFAVVQQLRSRYGVKAGHAGTLDPLASGLLLVLLGSATRLARYLVGLDKRYETEIRLGLRTTTGTGRVRSSRRAPSRPSSRSRRSRARSSCACPRPPRSRSRASAPTGCSGAASPSRCRSAVPRSTSCASSATEPPLVELDLKVSSGTYIRAIADHLGGHCRTIRRTAVGPFVVEDAAEENVLAPLAALVSLPERGLDEEETLAIRQGRSIPGSEQGPVALHFAGHLVAVAQGDGRTLRPETVLPAA